MKKPKELDIARLMMICGALNDLAEVTETRRYTNISDVAKHIIVIQKILEDIVSKHPKPNA